MFATIISKIWSEASSALIIKGFEKGGIYPFNNDVISIEKFDPESYKRWSLENRKNNSAIMVPEQSTGHVLEEQINLPSTSTANNEVVSEMSTNSNHPPIPSTSSEQSFPSPCYPISFESLLLEQLKQTPKTATTGRKRICTGAEVITSVEAVARLKEQIKEPKKTVASTKKKGKTVKRKRVYEEEDEESLEGGEENSDTDDNLDDELADVCEENEFMTSLEKTSETIKTGDWILVKFATKKSFKFYVGQVTAVEPCLEAKFARRLRSSSSQFHWPDTEDVSVITTDQIHLYLPPPNIHKRGHFDFNITFEQNVY